MAYAGGAAAAHYAAVANAIKASGAIIHLEADDFFKVLHKIEKPLVVIATGGWLNKNFQYLTSYKGLVFFTKNRTPLNLPGNAEIIAAKQIWIPG